MQILFIKQNNNLMTLRLIHIFKKIKLN